MVMFVSMNAVKKSALKPIDACAQHQNDPQSDKINVEVIPF